MSNIPSPDKEQNIELKIPTYLGYERVAMATASALARQMGLSENRINDLNTALTEAILNAIEHGSQDSQQQIFITFTQAVGKLIVSIRDQGPGYTPPAPGTKPNISDKLASKDSPRGWGWFLIEQLVDHVEVSPVPGGGTIVRFSILLEDS